MKENFRNFLNISKYYLDKMNLQENYACPFCWHDSCKNKHSKGIAIDSLVEMIEFEGGTLDKAKTCNKCHMNYTLSLICNFCKPDQPCHKHYAAVYNGCQWTKMPRGMHRIYMRNSPYCPLWQSRPEQIGRWYGAQVENYVDACNTLTRMTNNVTLQQEIHALRNVLDRAYEKKDLLWNGLYGICRKYFSGSDKCSRAVNSYYHTIIKKL
jgi:hypothetical protein